MPPLDCSRSLDFGWPLWPIITISNPLSRILLTSTCTLVTKRAGGVEHVSPRASASAANCLRYAVGAEMTVAPAGLPEFLNEDRALGLEVVTT